MKIISFKDFKESKSKKEDEQILKSVRKIIKEVREKGDESVRFYTKKFDNQDLSNFEITKEEIKESYKSVSPKLIIAIKKASQNIEFFAKSQLQLKDFEIDVNGVILGQKIIPLESVGCYIPGGNYPLPSTALMTIIPARVAGVKNIFVCSPKISPLTIVTADISGASKIFKIGGVQAIAALAYGTESIPKVDKIVGPGNKYVAAAKKEVYGEVGIDFIAGPSEVLIIADETTNPKYVAADLLAQAEHDIDAISNLITFSEKTANEVNKELEIQLNNLKTKDIAGKSIEKGSIILVDSINQAIELSNFLAPEHLELQIKKPKIIIGKLVNYGSLFIGKYSAEVFGDYCSGTNHTLPTGKSSRYTGGLSVKDFVKVLTYQEITEESKNELIDIASKLAESEGLDAHRNAAKVRRD